MGGVFSRPKPPPAPVMPDTSGANAARKRAEKETSVLQKKNDARMRNIKNRRRGRSLLAYHGTGEMGVTSNKKNKLGD